ncbi:hypothetical protein HXY33_01325 [Candidatus Bathyarchaeota archaeon]|nr:hypothetical protein [Candidatus Bathyarchaeota archaeon]
MIPNPTMTVFTLLIFGVSASILLMLLPAFYELKKPKDAGPRRFTNETLLLQPKMAKIMLITNMEEDCRLSKPPLNKILDIVAVLPNLEA